MPDATAKPATMERFWAKVQKTETCWLWTASTFTHGYGAFSWNGRTSGAHRFAYETFVGPIPEGHDIDHLCHTPACVRPEHLNAVTKGLNQQNRGRLPSSNTSGYRGVSLDARSQTWTAAAQVRGHLTKRYGFATAEEANEVAVALRLELMTYNLLDRRAGYRAA